MVCKNLALLDLIVAKKKPWIDETLYRLMTLKVMSDIMIFKMWRTVRQYQLVVTVLKHLIFLFNQALNQFASSLAEAQLLAFYITIIGIIIESLLNLILFSFSCLAFFSDFTSLMFSSWLFIIFRVMAVFKLNVFYVTDKLMSPTRVW